MKNKFTYIKTIELLFLLKYNTEHAEFNLFIWNICQNRTQFIHVWKDKGCVYCEY